MEKDEMTIKNSFSMSSSKKMKIGTKDETKKICIYILICVRSKINDQH